MTSRLTISAVLLSLLIILHVAPAAFSQPATIRVSVNHPDQSACNLALPVGVHSCTIHLETTPSALKTARFKLVSSGPVAWYGTPPGQEYNLTFATCIGGGAQIENFGIELFGLPQVLTIEVVPATGYASIELTDCSGAAVAGEWTCDIPVATEPSTWGRVKALYRE